MAAATGPAATRDSCASGDLPHSASARRRAGGRWSAADHLKLALVEVGVAARLARADGGSPRFSNESAARGAPRPARKSGLRRSGRRLKRSPR
jgi:hypothetical protein